MGSWSRRYRWGLISNGYEMIKFGGIGHYATGCPSKGTGTGKDGGGKKGGKNYGGKFGGKDGGGKKGGKNYGGKFVSKGFGKDGTGPSAKGGKGRGPMDGSGCWNCGGAHFAFQCTQSSQQQQQKGRIQSLCGLKTADIDEDISNVFLTTGTRFVADMSRMESGKESFYRIVSEKPVKGKKFCERFKDACMDDCCYVDSGDEGIDDF